MRNKTTEFLSIQEIKDLYRQCDRTHEKGLRDFCILSLMLHTGLRRHEVVALRRKNLNAQGKTLYLYARTKGERERKIPLKDLELIEALGKYFKKIGLDDAPDAAMFFSTSKNPAGQRRPITDETVRRVVESRVKQAKILKRITPHSLRHTFITQALHAGADIKTTQALAGHANISTTSRYLHTTEERMEEAIAKLKF